MNSLLRKITSLSCGALLSFSALATALAPVFAPPAFAKVWTIDERQLQLMQDINNAEKSKQITSKEARSLRKLQANIARKKAALRGQHRGVLTKEDIAKLNKDLDAASNKTRELIARK
jgi:hypothetical protein